MSPITYHLSPITYTNDDSYYISPITYHLSPITYTENRVFQTPKVVLTRERRLGAGEP